MTGRSESQIQQIWMQKMCKVCLAFLVILILFSDSSEAARRLDCTLFVFHPNCRGVAAKRSESEFALDPRSSVNEDSGADRFKSNGVDEDFLEFTNEDFGDKKQSGQPTYDLGLAAKIWPHIKKALLVRNSRGGLASDVNAFSPLKRSSNEAKLEKWSKVLRHLLEQQEK